MPARLLGAAFRVISGAQRATPLACRNFGFSIYADPPSPKSAAVELHYLARHLIGAGVYMQRGVLKGAAVTKKLPLQIWRGDP